MTAGPALPSSMHGAMLLGAGHVEIREVALAPPGPGSVVVRIGAATTCGTDVKVFRRGGHPRMLRVPTLFGHEMAGTVAAVGDGVEGAAPGDRVVVANSAPCGTCGPCREGRENLCEDLHYLNGAFAEYLTVPPRFVRRALYPLPDGLAFERAALSEPLACVVHGADACGLPPDRGVEAVVYGAGPIGLLFVAVLARAGHRVVLADPNPSRLAAGERLGAAATVAIARGGGQAEAVRAHTERARGAAVAVDCTGVVEVWRDAVHSVHPGGTVNLFGGCAPGTRLDLDTHWLHYGEITVKGVYHHRPATFRRALALLGEPDFDVSPLLSAERPLAEVEAALRSMMAKEALKVVIRPG